MVLMFTQNNVDSRNVYLDKFRMLYFVACAILFGLVIHILLGTLIIQVCGHGLSTFGPLGSIIRTVEGMRAEQQNLIGSFIVLVFVFSMSTMIDFWTVFNMHEAITCSAIFCIQYYLSYNICQRIYRRLYWKESEKNWNDGDEESGRVIEDDEDWDDPNPAINSRIKGSNKDEKEKSFKRKEGARFSDIFGNLSTLSLSFKKRSTQDLDSSVKSSAGDDDAKSVVSDNSNSSYFASSTFDNSFSASMNSSEPAGVELGQRNSTQHWNIAMEGYFSTLVNVVGHRRKKWQRRYFVMFNNGCIFVFMTRQDFRLAPKEPIYTFM